MASDREHRNGFPGNDTDGSDGQQHCDRDHGGIHGYQVVAATATKAILINISRGQDVHFIDVY